MTNRRTPNSAFVRLWVATIFDRYRVAILLVLIGSTYLGAVVRGSNEQNRPVATARILSLGDRVAYERAIENVYWRNRTWAGPASKPSLDEVISPSQLEQKVINYLRNSLALEEYWQQTISAKQLQAEMERMAKHTAQPQMLRELFEALGDDPFIIAECLARSALSERLVRSLYAHDARFHGELKRRAEAELRAYPIATEMNQTSGKYSEIEWVKSDGQPEGPIRGAESSVRIGSEGWTEILQRLQAVCGSEEAGVFSPLQEDDGRYYATAILMKTNDRLKLATIEWYKQPFESWRNRAAANGLTEMISPVAEYAVPTVPDTSNGLLSAADCSEDTWTPTNATNIPPERSRHKAVWTGSEMIIWGGSTGDPSVGWKYNPVTDDWTAINSAGAPSGEGNPIVLWSGNEMIVWGGVTNNSARYSPVTDSWTPISNVNAPLNGQVGVWTGSEMIVWGGVANGGGKYNPVTNTWTSISTSLAPLTGASAVWTGNEMIIWGGTDNSGGKYNPVTDTWTATSIVNAPDARYENTAVWTGTEMIIWGGVNGTGPLNTGGRYNPGTDTWTATSATNAPFKRFRHTAVWTGSQMIVWGGQFGNVDMVWGGGRYNPNTDTWMGVNTTSAADARSSHSAVWTGTEMIVWGGQYNDGYNYYVWNTGGRYNPAIDSWTATNTTTPPRRDDHTAVWIGNQMIVWGGYNGSGTAANTGGRYNPDTDSWIVTSTSAAPSARSLHTAVWTGSEMIVWGGYGFPYLNTGGIYHPVTDSWTATSVINAPTARAYHTAIWSGIEMIVWGGLDNTGGKYNPGTDSWIATSTTNAPAGGSTAVWSGSEMIVWDGADGSGGRYDPNANGWTATSLTNAPTARSRHTAVWTGSEMIVWGGGGANYESLNTGGRYDPRTDSWRATSITNAPDGRSSHAAVWTGSEMIVWGGVGDDYFSTGGKYKPVTDSWLATSNTNTPVERFLHTAVWTGSEMIVWGGRSRSIGGSQQYLNSGGKYCSEQPINPTPTPVPPIPTPTSTPSPSPAPSACVLGQGYWMNHPQAWCTETIRLGCLNYSQTQAIAIMRHNASQDKTYSLAQELVAAKLNVTCKHTDQSCVSSLIAAADNFLCSHPIGSGVTANSSPWQQVKATFSALAKYNSGMRCAPRCATD